MTNAIKDVFHSCIFGFLLGVLCTGAVAFGIDIYRSRLHRAEVSGLNEQVRKYGERAEQYSREIAIERRRIVDLRTEVAAGLEECKDIRDAVTRIRKQVEILAKYYAGTDCSACIGDCGDSIDCDEINESGE